MDWGAWITMHGSGCVDHHARVGVRGSPCALIMSKAWALQHGPCSHRHTEFEGGYARKQGDDVSFKSLILRGELWVRLLYTHSGTPASPNLPQCFLTTGTPEDHLGTLTKHPCLASHPRQPLSRYWREMEMYLEKPLQGGDAVRVSRSRPGLGEGATRRT